MTLKHRIPLIARKTLKPYLDVARSALPGAPAIDHAFLLYGQGRTGSTLLQKMLDQHPHVSCLGEPLGQEFRRPFISAWRVLEARASHAARAGAKLFGCHVKSYQLEEVYGKDPSAFVRRCATEGWKVIHLRRTRQCISTLVAEQRGTYHVPAGFSREALPAVEIDPHLLVKICRYRSRLLAEEIELAEELGFLQIRYETDLENAAMHQATASRCFEYLGISSVRVETPLARTSGRNLSDQISNFLAVRQALVHAGLGLEIG